MRGRNGGRPGATAVSVTMTQGKQHELTYQKNIKKQSNSVKGKCLDDEISAATSKQGDSEIMQQKQKKANKKKEEPKQLCDFVSSPLALRLCAWGLSHHAHAFSCNAHRSQHW